MLLRRTHQAGQSLLEVMFATIVIALALVALLSSVIASLRNSRVSNEQTAATKYAEEASEWMRQMRDQQGWGFFSSAIENRATGGTLTYCLPAMPANFSALLAAQAGACDAEDVIPSTVFRRQVVLTVVSPTTINVVVQVIWPGRSGDIITNLQTQLGDWDQ